MLGGSCRCCRYRSSRHCHNHQVHPAILKLLHVAERYSCWLRNNLWYSHSLFHTNTRCQMVKAHSLVTFWTPLVSIVILFVETDTSMQQQWDFDGRRWFVASQPESEFSFVHIDPIWCWCWHFNPDSCDRRCWCQPVALVIITIVGVTTQHHRWNTLMAYWKF